MRWTGKSLGARDRYNVTRRLGAGCLGETLEARDTTSGETVVIKLLDPAHARDRARVARLEAEVSAQAALRHPALGPLFAWLGDGEVIGAVRRYAPGQDLDLWIQNAQGVTEATTLALLDGVLEGLATAHQAGVAHLGLAPTNILVDGPADAPRVLLVDLGLARVLGPTAYLSVYPGSPLLAPEQTASPHLSDTRTDVYTLAVLFRAFGEGRRLTRAGAGSLGRRLPVSPELEVALARGSAADPSRRFADAGALRAALQARVVEADLELLEETADTVRQPPPTRPRSGPPPLPPSVTGEQDALRRHRTTQPNPVGKAQRASNPSLPAPAGWFSNISPTRPTWETTPVGKADQHGTAPPTLPPVPAAPPRTGGQTVRLMVPRAEEADATAPTAPPAAKRAGDNTLRMTSPFAGDASAEHGEAPSPFRSPPASAGSTTVLRVPKAAPDEAPAEPTPAPPAPSGSETTRLQIPLPADPQELASGPAPGREAAPEVAAPERVDKTMVIPAGRPAAIPAGPPDPAARADVPPSPFKRDAAEEAAAAPRVRHSAPTGELEAAAEAGAAGALGTFEHAGVLDTTRSQRYSRVGPPSRVRFLFLGVLLGLLVGGAGGFFVGHSLIDAPEASEPASHDIPEPTPAEPLADPDRPPPGPGETGLPSAPPEPTPLAEAVTPEPGTPEPGPSEPGTSEPDAAAPGATEPGEGDLALVPEGTGDGLIPGAAPGETPPGEAAAPLALAEPSPPALAGPLVFSPDLWQPGNYWIYRYRRTTPADAPEFQDLEYYTRRRVESVTEDPFGYRVTLVDEGGVTQPTRQEILATASCMLDLRDHEARFCLPLSLDGLVPTDVVGAPPGVVEISNRGETMTFSPWAGWVHESRVDRQDRSHEAQLVGYQLGARAEGLVDQQVLTCDWRAEDDDGSRAGRAGRDATPEMTTVAAWGLNGNVRRFDVPLVGEHGSAWLRAWTDGGRTAYQVLPEPVPGDASLADETVDTTRVELPLEDAKVWSTPDGLTDQVSLVFDDDDGTQMVRLVTISPNGVTDTELLTGARDRGARLSVVLLANLDSCYIQIRRGRWQAMRYADFQLDDSGATRIGGDLESLAPEE